MPSARSSPGHRGDPVHVAIVAIPFGAVADLDPIPFAGTTGFAPMNDDPQRDPVDPRIVSGRTRSGQAVTARLPTALNEHLSLCNGWPGTSTRSMVHRRPTM